MRARQWFSDVGYIYNAAPGRLLVSFAAGCILTALVVWFQRKTESKAIPVQQNTSAPQREVAVADSLRGGQDEWLHDKLKADKSGIRELIRFPGIAYNADFDKAQIDFVFSVFNNSLYDIVIENSVKGEIRYGEDNDAFYYSPKFLSETPIGCPSRSGTYFVVRQAIREEEIPRFRNADNVLIWFHSLQINFRGTNQFPEIESTPFDTQHYLETKKRTWRDWNHLDFIFGYTAEQWEQLRQPTPRVLAEQPELQEALTKSLTDYTELQKENARLNEAIGGKRQQYKTLQQGYERLERTLAEKNLELASIKSEHDSKPQAEPTKKKKKSDIFSDLVVLRGEGDNLLAKALEGSTSGIPAKFQEWESRVAAYLSKHLDIADRDEFLTDKGMIAYESSQIYSNQRRFMPDQGC